MEAGINLYVVNKRNSDDNYVLEEQKVVYTN